jgi:tetratricopeptide (TPR) repeat protein
MYHHTQQGFILLRHGEKALASKRYAQAVNLFERSRRTGLDSTRLLISLGQAAMLSRRYALAEDCFNRLASRQPEDLQWQFNLANISFIRQDYDQALERLDPILRSRPHWEQALFLQAKALTATGQFAAAIKNYQLILEERQ